VDPQLPEEIAGRLRHLAVTASWLARDESRRSWREAIDQLRNDVQEADLKLVQELLGHSTITLTGDVYTTVLPEVARAAAEGVAQLLRDARAADIHASGSVPDQVGRQRVQAVGVEARIGSKEPTRDRSGSVLGRDAVERIGDRPGRPRTGDDGCMHQKETECRGRCGT